MPEIAANETQGTLVAWTVKPGESFAAGACLAEIETDKATVELPAEEPGVMGEQLVAPGQDVLVSTPICVLLAEGEEAVAAVALAGANGASAAPPAAVPVARPSAPAGPARSGRLFSSPLARRYARELGVDIAGLAGRGPNGRIVRRDVEAAAQAPAVAPPARAGMMAVAAAGAPDAPVAIPHSRLRQTIARRLSESTATVPHFYLTADLQVDRLLELRREINEGRAEKISMTDFLVRAVAVALMEVPDTNVSWTADAMLHHAHADVAVAVATQGGLVTPIVRAAETKTLSAVNAELADLVARARSGRLHPREYEGGSFTISNLGMYGVQGFSAIINPPQSAILAVGAARRAPVVKDDVLTVGTLMHCTLSVDHRAIDGALAAQWLAAFQQLVERPAGALV